MIDIYCMCNMFKVKYCHTNIVYGQPIIAKININILHVY